MGVVRVVRGAYISSSGCSWCYESSSSCSTAMSGSGYICRMLMMEGRVMVDGRTTHGGQSSSEKGALVAWLAPNGLSLFAILLCELHSRSAACFSKEEVGAKKRGPQNEDQSLLMDWQRKNRRPLPFLPLK